MRDAKAWVGFLVKSPILWGGLASAGFYGLVHGVFADNLLLRQIFADHPIEYATTIMFFVGLAALGLKLFDLAGQRAVVGQPHLGPRSREVQPATSAGALLARLERIPPRHRGDYLVRRLRDALDFVARRDSATGLEEHLRYLSDMDAARAHASYALVRVVIWAIPILGFLGTVVGITMAIGKLSPDALEKSLPEVMVNLSIAFNTTTQALALSIVIMFTNYFADRAETSLLGDVDAQADAELVGRFQSIAEGPEGQVDAVRQMAGALLAAQEQLAARQTELWTGAIASAGAASERLVAAAGTQLQAALPAALEAALEGHARRLAELESAAGEKHRRQWDRLEQALVANTQGLATLADAVLARTESAGRAAAAAGEIEKLEAALNRNLAALAASGQFQETLLALNAAIHLLTGRLGHAPAATVSLEAHRKPSQAA